MPASHLLVLNAAEGRIQTVVACPVGELERYGTPAPSTDPDRDGGYVVRCAQSWHAPSQGAELLTPILRELCARLRITPADIGKIAVVRGPGSFTGLRLALATASGLARATGAVLTGIDYLPLLAASAMWRMGPAAVPGRLLWVLTHARKRLVHAQGFVVLPDTGEARISPVSALGALEVRTPEDALRDLFTDRKSVV